MQKPFQKSALNARIYRFRADGVALVKSAVEDTNLEQDGIGRRIWILNLHCIFYRTRNGFGFCTGNQAFETRVERNRVILLRLLVPIHQRRLHKLTVHRLEIIDHHIIIMWVVGAKWIVRISFIETQIAIAVGITERQDAFTTESAVGVEDIGETIVSDMRLDGIFHLLTARNRRQKHHQKRYQTYPLHPF